MLLSVISRYLGVSVAKIGIVYDMCKLFRLIVPGRLKETVLKACAKYAASSLAKFELSRIIRIEQAISQQDIHASHESAEQGVVLVPELRQDDAAVGDVKIHIACCKALPGLAGILALFKGIALQFLFGHADGLCRDGQFVHREVPTLCAGCPSAP